MGATKTNSTPPYIYPRIAGYVFTLVLHIGNMIYMSSFIDEDALKSHPSIEMFGTMQHRFFTCWNFFIQMMYAVAGLSCDLLTLMNADKKDYKLPKHLRGFRDTLFASVLWPCTFVVFTIFWSLFIYNRELICPKIIDKVLTPFSNHVIHTVILPIVLWEVLFQPRRTPKSHVRNLLHLTFHFLLYFSVLVYTYIERGFWLYPVMNKMYGTVYFPILMLSIFGMALIFYYFQWTVTWIVWGSKKPIEKQR